MRLDELVDYLDRFLDVEGHPDYGGAHNGLEVGGVADVELVAVAVDASEETISDAADADADLLLVHHGLFWEGLRPLTGRRLRRVVGLLEGKVAVYASHLPLDAHPEVGNCALLARELDIPTTHRFGFYDGRPIGWRGRTEIGREELRDRLAGVVDGPVRLVPGGPEEIREVAVVTGGGGSFISAAADEGVDALVTGEGSHHTYIDAMELGVNLYYGGHYATETLGVRALGEHLERRFGLAWRFLDRPTGF